MPTDRNSKESEHRRSDGDSDTSQAPEEAAESMALTLTNLGFTPGCREEKKQAHVLQVRRPKKKTQSAWKSVDTLCVAQDHVAKGSNSQRVNSYIFSEYIA